MIVAGYASGHLRLYNFKTGHLSAEVVAHGRSISAVDVAKNGYVSKYRARQLYIV